MALSTHPGGAADKSGGEHEVLWGVRAMLQVLNGEASAIRIEEPGVDGAEFYLQRESHREYWQAKRQITSQDTWTLRRLDAEGILGFFFSQYHAGHRSVFASVAVLRGLYTRGSHEIFTARDIEDRLALCGITRRIGSRNDTPRRIRDISRTYLGGQQANLIRHTLIRRSVADDLVRGIVESTGSIDALVTSQAGGGKSGCLCQVAESLEKAGLLVLAFPTPPWTSAKLSSPAVPAKLAISAPGAPAMSAQLADWFSPPMRSLKATNRRIALWR